MAFGLSIFKVFIFYFSVTHIVHGDVLYTGNDPVNILNFESLESFIWLRPHYNLVQFYNSWCGHCIRFAPTWNEFAESIDGKLL